MYNAPRPHIHRKIASPCYNCTDRCVGCHSECQRFADFRATLETEKQAAKDASVEQCRAQEYEVSTRKAKNTGGENELRELL